MGIEIDFLAVGEGEKSGDAIALRYGNLYSDDPNDQTVVIIDGGTKDSGARLVQHVQTRFRSDKVDFVFLTHPDGDHASGLTEVIDNLDVKLLVMHQPWNHASDIRHLFKDGRITDNSLEARIRNSLQAAHDVEQLAVEKGIQIFEGFQGVATKDGAIQVLGPTREYYQSLLPAFRRTPEAKESLASSYFRKAADAISTVFESMSIETLTDAGNTISGQTSVENNSSMILLVTVDDERYLFTGDAGIAGLTAAADYCDQQGIPTHNFHTMQVPHHGSKRNVGPTILNRIKGTNAVISAASGGAPKHPSKKVTNALIRRGSNVYATQGTDLGVSRNAPQRAGWTSANSIPFYDSVEE